MMKKHLISFAFTLLSVSMLSAQTSENAFLPKITNPSDSKDKEKNGKGSQIELKEPNEEKSQIDLGEAFSRLIQARAGVQYFNLKEGNDNGQALEKGGVFLQVHSVIPLQDETKNLQLDYVLVRIRFQQDTLPEEKIENQELEENASGLAINSFSTTSAELEKHLVEANVIEFEISPVVQLWTNQLNGVRERVKERAKNGVDVEKDPQRIYGEDYVGNRMNTVYFRPSYTGILDGDSPSTIFDSWDAYLGWENYFRGKDNSFARFFFEFGYGYDERFNAKYRYSGNLGFDFENAFGLLNFGGAMEYNTAVNNDGYDEVRFEGYVSFDIAKLIGGALSSFARGHLINI